MSRRLLALALLAPMVAGCGIMYKMKAKGWGETLTEINTQLRAAGDTAARAGTKIATDRALKDGLLEDLESIQVQIDELRIEVGTGGHPAHGDLLEGLDLLNDAVNAFIEMVEFANPSKKKEFETLGQEARDKLESWANEVRGPQTG